MFLCVNKGMHATNLQASFPADPVTFL